MSVEASAAMGCRAMRMDEGMCRRGIDYGVGCRVANESQRRRGGFFRLANRVH